MQSECFSNAAMSDEPNLSLDQLAAQALLAGLLLNPTQSDSQKNVDLDLNVRNFQSCKHFTHAIYSP